MMRSAGGVGGGEGRTLAGIWSRYQRIGISESLPAAEARHVRTLNGMVLIVSALLWLQLPIIVSALPASRFILASFLLWPLLAQLVPFLNHLGRHTAARVLYSVSTVALVAVNAAQLGPVTENHLLMIAVCVGSFLIYPPRQVRLLAAMVAVTAGAAVALEWSYRRHGALLVLPPHFTDIARWSSMSALFTIIVGILVYHYRVVTRAERMLELEHQRSERLLRNILPGSVADRLKRNETRIADRIDDASILFADLIGFTELADRVPHERVVEILDELFSEFDRIGARRGLEKIKTIGDAYMLAGGVPAASADHHRRVAACALEMLAYIRSQPVAEQRELGVRIGIHCGPVVAGVICQTKFAYDVWGDTVNIASRMESHGQADRIQVSAAFYEQTREAYEYQPRGTVPIKGKGMMETYFLVGPASSQPARTIGAAGTSAVA